jgi:hypothetical protein
MAEVKTSRVFQMLSQHDVVSVVIEEPKDEKRDDGTRYQTMDIVIHCKDKESNFKLSLTLFSGNEKIDVMRITRG